MKLYTIIIVFIAAIALPLTIVKALLYYLNNMAKRSAAKEKNNIKVQPSIILIQSTEKQIMKNAKVVINKLSETIYIKKIDTESSEDEIIISVEDIISYSRKGEVLTYEKTKEQIDNRITVLEYTDKLENEQSIYFESKAYDTLLSLIPEKEIEAVKKRELEEKISKENEKSEIIDIKDNDELMGRIEELSKFLKDE